MFLKRSLLIGAVALSLFSCSKDAGKQGAKTNGYDGTPNEYIKSYNKLIKTPYDLTGEYYKRFSTKELNVKMKNPRLFPSHNNRANDLKEIRELIAAGKKAKPNMPIVPFADSALLATDSIFATFENAYNYYDSKDYVADKWEKGKEYHASMAKHSALLNRSLNNMSSVLQKEEEARDKKEIESLKNKSGFAYRYRSYNLAMKVFHRSVGSPEQAAALETLKSEMSAINDFIGQNGSHKWIKSFEIYKRDAQGYLNAAKKIANSNPKTADMNSLMEDLTSEYNSVISMTNSLAKDEAQGYFN